MSKSLQNVKWFVSPHITKAFISIIIIIIIKTKYYQKLERSKFDEIFNESVDSSAKVECYPEFIRDQFKTLVMGNMQPNNNLCEDVVVIYQKLTKNSDPEKFFSEFYGKIALQSEKYVGVKNPQSTLITSKIAEKLLHYFICIIFIALVLQQGAEGSLSSSSEAEQDISLSERELHGLQYLAGYVVSNLMKKVKNDKNYSSVENQNILSILDASITKDISNQMLVRSVTRGGLGAVNNKCINIFINCGETFRKCNEEDKLAKNTN